MEDLSKYLKVELSEFHSELNGLKPLLSGIKLDDAKDQRELDNNLAKIIDCINTLKIHIDFWNSELEDVNFYRLIIPRFSNDKKKIEFYIQENYDDPQLVTDEKVLDTEFTIQNCFPNFKLIPLQLADNAHKYMLVDQVFSITLCKSRSKRFITCENFGPHISKEETELISSPGYRGKETGNISGMGLGIYQINMIVALHRHINAQFHWESDNDKTEISGNYYSKYKTDLAYELSSIPQDVMINKVDEANLLEIVCHNSQITINELVEICSKITYILNNNNKHCRKIIYQFQTSCNLFQHVINTVLFCYNGFELTKVLRDIVTVRIDNIIIRNIETLSGSKYLNKNLHFDYQGELKSIDFEKAVYPCVSFLIDRFLNSLPKESYIEITFEDDTIIIKCELANKSFMENNSEQKFIKALFEYWKVTCDIKEDTLNTIIKIELQ